MTLNENLENCTYYRTLLTTQLKIVNDTGGFELKVNYVAGNFIFLPVPKGES